VAGARRGVVIVVAAAVVLVLLLLVVVVVVVVAVVVAALRGLPAPVSEVDSRSSIKQRVSWQLILFDLYLTLGAFAPANNHEIRSHFVRSKNRRHTFIVSLLSMVDEKSPL
jgi:hypothetical protein